MKRVVHCLREPYDIYIGRAMPRYRLPASKWHNPFKIPNPERPGDRERAIDYYRDEHLPAHPELVAALPELWGKVLGCWCAPEACHGDVLVELSARLKGQTCLTGCDASG